MLALSSAGEAAAITGGFALVTLLVGWFLNRKISRVDDKVTGIDKAVNSRPPEQPALYDLVQTIDLKVDHGFAQGSERMNLLDRRLTVLGDEVSTLHEKVDKKA